LDKQTIINSVIKTNKVVVVEEGWPYAGIASEISCVINEEAFDYLDNSVIRVTGEDVPLPYAANLEKAALPTVEKIVDAVLKVCYKN
jgi:pyruvate dehydrogenase E1 component beta subunit